MDARDVLIVLDSGFSEEPHFLVEIRTPAGSLSVLGEMEFHGNHLIVHGLHIGGDATIRWGWSGLRQLARLIAEKLDVDYIEIHGAVRTTGAYPGRRPRSVRLTRSTAT